MALCTPSKLRADPSDSVRIAKELTMLSDDQLLDQIQSGTWLNLPALSEVTVDEQQSYESLAKSGLQALAQEARVLSSLSDATLLRRTLRVAAISQMAAKKGGYLNDLIATSADQVFLLGAWTLLDKSPSLASKLLPALEAREKLSSAKAWLLKRYAIDPDLVAKKEALDAMRSDASGFQAVMQLQKEGRDVNDLPSILDQVRHPELALLWWTVYTMDYRMVVLRAGVAYVEGGGRFTDNMNEFRATCASIFGKDGIPYTHELKRGSIFPESISREWNAVRDASVRELQTTQWFGKP